ncbi:MAG: Na+:H+ dicarboxylate symporter [Bdellovibrionaceae bacterium]|nr:Na+:H+ dicarboxylate symporter [Pseudobdellovibrionaceae bacterium]|tara:strand:- start:36739 stop:38028 length:1290 start_codon:yes stop_codon:yes gene_type:complete
MLKKITTNTSFLCLLSSIIAFALAKGFGDNSWLSGDAPEIYSWILLLKNSFLALLKMLIAPLIFFSLLGGLFHIGELTRLRSLGKIAILYYLGTTFIAILIGLTVVFFIHPWEAAGVQISVDDIKSGTSAFAYSAPKQFIEQQATGLSDILSKIFSKALVNPFESLMTNNILGIVFAALMFGLCSIYVLPKENSLSKVVDEVNQILNQFLKVLIKFLPIGLFAIVFDLSLKVSSNIFESLLSFCLVVFGATLVHGFIVLPLIAKFTTGISYVELFRKIGKALVVAFSTSSSSATLPVSMEVAEKELGVSKSVSGFVFPLGATMNMDGTALFEGVAAVFLAYLFNVDLGPVGVISIFFMAMLSSVGAPGMPSGSMSAMQMVLLAAGIPLEGIGILLVVERPLDTFRTAVNVEGDIIGAAVVQSYLDKSKS